MPARERRMASVTFSTASSWPMTRWCSTSSRCSSFSRSPSMSFATGMPVQRATMRAISSSVTLSRSSVRRCFSLSAIFSSSSSSRCSCGRRPYLSSAARLRSYSRCAFSICALTCSISSRSFCTLPMDCFSFSHLAFISLKRARMSASSFWISARCSCEMASVSFLRAASSISCCMILRRMSSSSWGMESISVRIIAQASSTRSMALSGRKRSEI